MLPDFEAIARKLQAADPITVAIAPHRLFILAAQLQLALRHPANTGGSARTARDMIENIKAELTKIDPAATEALNTTVDMTREQWEWVEKHPEQFEDIQIENASNLLLAYAHQEGRPMILAARGDMKPSEGLRPGNSETIDLEIIRGLTIAIPCNGIEAQIIINGVNTILEALIKARGNQNFPFYWRNELSGELAAAIEAHMSEGQTPTPEQIKLIRDYFRQFVNATCWEGSEALEQLRSAVDGLQSSEDVDTWMFKALDLGIDPL